MDNSIKYKIRSSMEDDASRFVLGGLIVRSVQEFSNK